MFDRKADEELAEQYAVENWEFYEEGQTDYKALKEAYLAGFKAARAEQWHDLRKNPDDLPESGVQVLSEKGDIVVYKRDRFCWFEYSPNADNIRLRNWEKPVAWCEKPKLEEVDR